MPEITEGRVVGVSEDGAVEISLVGGEIPDVGTRFSVLNENGKRVAEIKVIEANSSRIVARRFASFKAAQGVGAASGAALGTVLFPAVGTIVGATVGALAASAATRKVIRGGMKVVPISKVAATPSNSDESSS
jgi:hypothetical protein